MINFLLAFTLFVASPVAMASQSTAYYPGYVNPNGKTGDDVNYRDAVTVIQDLVNGNFSALYIMYHGCV